MAANSSSQSLVKLLSAQPPPGFSVTPIFFEQVGMPEYKDHFATLINGLFSEAECQALLRGAEASTPRGWEPAMVNVGNGKQELITDTRLCDRILWDNPDVAASVLQRVTPWLPTDIVTLRDKPKVTGIGPQRRKETWRLSRLNERLRFLRYTEGMYFRTHCDGSYVTPDHKEITFVTVHLYLNGGDSGDESAAKSEDKPLRGGATRFLGNDWKTTFDVNPSTGSVLVFQHRNLLHSGEDVVQGTKYTMRSDILYHKVEQ